MVDSNGELKKRLFDKRDSMCFECVIQAGYNESESDDKPKICKTKREPTREEQIKVLDEAKKEFPKPTWHLEDLITLEAWFKKWFGGVKDE